MHDLFHASVRCLRSFAQPKMMQIVKTMLAKIKPHMVKRSSYYDKLNVIGHSFPRFFKKPTQDELLAYIIESIMVYIIDSGYAVYSTNPDFEREILYTSVDAILTQTFRGLNNSFISGDDISIGLMRQLVHEQLKKC